MDYRKLAEAIPALIWISDVNGRTIFANRRWFDYTGIDLTQLAPEAFFTTLVHPEDVDPLIESWNAVRDGSSAIEAQYRIRTRDGSYRAIAAHAVPLRDDDGQLRQWLGAAMDVQQQRDAAAEVMQILAAVPHIVFVSAPNGTVEYYNRRWYEYTGLPHEESLEDGWAASVHPDDRERLADSWLQCRDTGIPFFGEFRLRRAADGTYRWHSVTSQAVRREDGSIARWIGVTSDIEDQKRRETTLAFLADSSELLAESFDVERRLHVVAERAVPEFADWCGIYLLRDGELRPVAIAHRDPEQIRLAEQLLREYPVRIDDDVLRRILSGRTMFVPTIPDEMLKSAAQDERHYALMRELEMRSSIQVPLQSKGEPLGFVHFVNGPSGRIYDNEDVRTIEILARRISVAIENARIFERERRVAHTFQHAALPRTLPEVPGVSLSAVYHPAVAEAEIGGDWYDAFRVTDDTLVLSMGDVSGKGLQAAVLMSTVRQSIRVAALEGLDVARIAAVADKALQLEYPGAVVSALIVAIDLRTRACTYLNAGHPPAVVRGADGDLQMLDLTNVPFGVLPDRNDEVGRIALADKAMLALYTDGLIEASRDVLSGVSRLREVLAADAMAHTPNPARLLFDALLHGGARDDVAILTVSFGRSRHWSLDAQDAVRAQGARSAFARHLREEGAEDSDFAGAEVIFGELVGNVVRYAPGLVDLDLEWSGEQPVLHVLDRGEPFELKPMLPEDILSENGRGLFIVRTLGEGLTVRPVPGRGNHVSVRLPVRRKRSG